MGVKSIDELTLRDYFAAAALPAVFARQQIDTMAEVAEWCYVLADALLEERDKPAKDS